MDTLRQQPDRGRDQSRLSHRSRAHQYDIPPPALPARPDTSSIHDDYAQRVLQVADYRHRDSTVGTYSAAWNKFLTFCAYANQDPSNPYPNYPSLLCDFAVYAREDARPTITPRVIDSYISGIRAALQHFGLIAPSTVIRSPLLKQLLTAYIKEYDERHPERETCTVPMTFPLLTEALSVANGLFSGTERLCVRAALAAGYACSLRPGEYLDEGGRHF